MKRWLKWTLGVVGGMTGLVVASLGYVVVALPEAGATPALKVTPSDELKARGHYLTHNVSMCISCHSTRDFGYFAGPVKAGTEGRGGEKFAREHGLPGDIISSNITPSSLSSWSDGEVAHAITAGINKSGKALFPVMPYPGLSHLCESDLHAIILSLRELKPISNTPPSTVLDFPVSVLVRTMPKPPEPWACPEPSNEKARGEYLTQIASCGSCHTPIERGQPIQGKEFAGGFEFRMNGGAMARSANITPHPTSGIGKWSKEQFVRRFKAYEQANPVPVKAGAPNTPMPWYNYAGMKDEDLGAIYVYLRSLEPIDNKVEAFGRW